MFELENKIIITKCKSSSVFKRTIKKIDKTINTFDRKVSNTKKVTRENLRFRQQTQTKLFFTNASRSKLLNTIRILIFFTITMLSKISRNIFFTNITTTNSTTIKKIRNINVLKLYCFKNKSLFD